MTHGDLNSDGYDDVIIGASGDDEVATSAGAYYVGLGSKTGVQVLEKFIPDVATTSTYVGYWVSSGRDIDADGFDDILVSASGVDSAVAVFGSEMGVDAAKSTALTRQDTTTTERYYAYSGCLLGDTTGYGYGNVLIGDWGADIATTVSDEGVIYVYPGSAIGVDPKSEVLMLAEGTPEHGYFGGSVTDIGDVNADGLADLAVQLRTSSRGTVTIYHGTSTATLPSYVTTLQASDYGDYYYGDHVDGVGDLNADGYDDIAIGAINSYDTEDGTSEYHPGAAYVYYGSVTGLDQGSEVKLDPFDVDPDASLDGYARYVAAAGDVNGDGYDDLAVGAEDDGGRVYFYWGGPDGVSTDDVAILTSPDDDTTVRLPAEGGDIDGDGYDDLLVKGKEGDANAVYVLYGACDDDDDDGVCALDDCDDTDPHDTTTPSTWYLDGDGDGAGDPDTSAESCVQPTDYVADAADCDDDNPDVHPGTDELCNDVDDDCDGTVDGPDATDATDWYPDADGDSYTSDAEPITDCVAPSGYAAATETDCNDDDPGIHPDATEVADDGVDQDCDGRDLVTPVGDTGSTADTGQQGPGGCGSDKAARLLTAPARSGCSPWRPRGDGPAPDGAGRLPRPAPGEVLRGLWLRAIAAGDARPRALRDHRRERRRPPLPARLPRGRQPGEPVRPGPLRRRPGEPCQGRDAARRTPRTSH